MVNKTIDLETSNAINNIEIKTENHNNIVEQNNKTKSLNTFELDDNFQNRKARRNFVKIMNASRVERSFKTVIDQQTKKRKNIKTIKVNRKEPKISWKLMPKFTKAMSEKYSQSQGIVFGWRNPNKLNKIRKTNGTTQAF